MDTTMQGAMRRPELLRVTGLSNSQIKRLESAGSFPVRFRLGAGAVAWDRGEVLAWLDERRADRVRTVAS